MITGFEGICLYVRDQDEALKFYVEKLGFVVRSDIQAEGAFRWVTVSPPGQQGIEVTLYRPGPWDGDDAARLEGLIGQHPRWAFLTDDCQGTYADLTARGVHFITPPTTMPYAIEALFEDIYGNVFVLHQRATPATAP
jgi:predicted enzyme related to lactoylglutathione lyase